MTSHRSSVHTAPAPLPSWKDQWQDSDTCSNRHCCKKFSLTNRKHHCRTCGAILCNDCCPKKAKLPQSVSPFMDERPTNAEHTFRQCNQCALPRCFQPYPSRPNGPIRCRAMDHILKYLNDKTTNALLQSCSPMHKGFHAPGVPYYRTPQERFPSLWSGAKIGKGGCGTVFRVEDKYNNGSVVAVKVVEKPSIHCWFVWRRMLGEIQIMQANQHENVAGLLEQFQTPDRLLLTLEIGGGGSLRHGYEVIKRKQFNMEVFIAHMIKQAALGLKYLYKEKNVVHRDIKAENIVLSRDFGRVMIIDFGLAEHIDSSITQSFVPCGTIGYASPENIAAVVERKKVFPASGDTMHAADIFSLGVVAFILLGGVKPLRGTRFMELHAEVRRGIRCEGARWANVSSEAKNLLEWMLHSSTHLRATVDDIVNHDFVTRAAPLFSKYQEELQKENYQVDENEANEWSFVGAEGSEWMFVDEDLDEFGGEGNGTSSATEKPTDSGAANVRSTPPPAPIGESPTDTTGAPAPAGE